MTKRDSISKNNLFFILKTENNRMEAHGVIGTQEEARAQAKMIDGVLLPLSSLKDLRAEVADAKPEKTTLTGKVTRGKPHLETIQLDGNEPEKISALKCVALGYSIRETAELLERSIGTVQVRLRELEYEGLVENLKGAKGERIARGRVVTKEGIKLLG